MWFLKLDATTLRAGVTCLEKHSESEEKGYSSLSPSRRRRFNGAFGLFSNETPPHYNAKNKVLPSARYASSTLAKFPERVLTFTTTSTIWFPFFTPFHTDAGFLAFNTVHLKSLEYKSMSRANTLVFSNWFLLQEILSLCSSICISMI